MSPDFIYLTPYRWKGVRVRAGQEVISVNLFVMSGPHTYLQVRKGWNDYFSQNHSQVTAQFPKIYNAISKSIGSFPNKFSALPTAESTSSDATLSSWAALTELKPRTYLHKCWEEIYHLCSPAAIAAVIIQADAQSLASALVLKLFTYNLHQVSYFLPVI